MAWLTEFGDATRGIDDAPPSAIRRAASRRVLNVPLRLMAILHVPQHSWGRSSPSGPIFTAVGKGRAASRENSCGKRLGASASWSETGHRRSATRIFGSTMVTQLTPDDAAGECDDRAVVGAAKSMPWCQTNRRSIGWMPIRQRLAVGDHCAAVTFLHRAVLVGIDPKPERFALLRNTGQQALICVPPRPNAPPLLRSHAERRVWTVAGNLPRASPIRYPLTAALSTLRNDFWIERRETFYLSLVGEACCKTLSQIVARTND
jgi:hypothetical protein